MSYSTKEIKDSFSDLFENKSEDKKIKLDAYILMSKFLSEIERIQNENDINRKTLASNINTSPSYLTQVFRGDKPLNFFTLAKIQKYLNIKFDIKARTEQSKVVYLHDTQFDINENEYKKYNGIKSSYLTMPWVNANSSTTKQHG